MSSSTVSSCRVQSARRGPGGVWRFAFAFDPKRKAIILCGGDKSGGSQTRFYKRLIARADERFDAHLAALKRAETAESGSKKRKRRS